MRAVLIDDEIKMREKLKVMLARHCPEVSVVAEAGDAEEGIQAIKKHRPDLVFLDIQLSGLSGFDMLKKLKTHDFELIFITAFNQYAIQAIKFSALDYLLKPVRSKELAEAVAKAQVKTDDKFRQERVKILLSNLHAADISEHRLVVHSLKEKHFLNPAEIIRCESDNCYTTFYMVSGDTFLASKGIYEYEKLLKAYSFIRCHQSHLVNLKYIKSLRTQDTVSELLLTDSTLVPVSRLKKDFVKDELMK